MQLFKNARIRVTVGKTIGTCFRVYIPDLFQVQRQNSLKNVKFQM